jgi:hypothetical protein
VFGDQIADPKPPLTAVVNSHGRERRGKVGTLIPAGMIEIGERKRTNREFLRREAAAETRERDEARWPLWFLQACGGGGDGCQA